MFNNKPKKSSTTTDDDKGAKTSGVPYTPDALLALLAKQQYKDDTWKPSVINYRASGVPAVQTQLAGTQYYDTTDNQYMAPGYEHLRDITIKKDLALS